MAADPRWLELLKASGWQTCAFAVALSLLFGLIHNGLLPNPGPLWIVVIAGAALVCGCLAIASILSALAKLIPIGRLLREVWSARASRKSVRSYIPFMTAEEREIVAYLLHHNQKTFTGAMDGGHARTLMSRGLVVMAMRPNQTFYPEDVPFAVPDLVWDEWAKHRDAFPYTATDGHPWRVSWMEW